MSRLSVIAVALATAGLTTVMVVAVDWDAFRAVKNPLELVMFVLVGWAFVGAGIASWRIRPHDNTGKLMIGAGLLWLARGFNFSSQPLLFTIGWALIVAYFAVLIQVVLGFPLGRLRKSWERWFVAGCYTYYLGSAMLELAFADPGRVAGQTSGEPINLLLIRDDPDVFDALQLVFGLIDVSIAVVMIVVLYRRWRRGSAAYRSAFAPLWIVALIGTAVVLTLYAIDATSPGALDEAGAIIGYAATILSPLSIALGLWRFRVARGAVSDVMVEVGAAPLGEDFSRALRRAVRDPSLVLWSWSADRRCYVDAEGLGHRLPDDDGPRAATVLERDGVPVGALVYDQSLRDQPQLIAAVRSAATVALDNHRLQAELEAQLEEVRQSRGRIVAAGDQQRRRLERDLHDGAQQRLVAASILLRRAQRSQHDPQMRDLLVQGAAELDSALKELRDLARGVYPPVLQERGLGAALDGLAERSPLPLEIVDDLAERPAAAVELAAYFIAAEAVTNAIKHSAATHVEIAMSAADGELKLVVADDGCGGATFGPGGGLSGLLDRASALGGRLSVLSPEGGGTTVTVHLPL
ncbi:sensor histidine kinase [Antrihabitans sp. NCIMB 15449]|uniref:histidine kinase n=1 Tax=Antrihabitans spumae TaxID=3373370 RepID=A0ABW7JL83_9NOCA